MSGITGIKYNTLKDTFDIKKMSDAIYHRGPDSEGFLAVSTFTGKTTALGGDNAPVQLPPVSSFDNNANLYMAHRQLSITDKLNTAHQPMSNRQKDMWITFDGEIYNFKSLRTELSEFTFLSNSDTEVLLYAYEKWGINCLKRLNGVWSFVIYDAKKNILFGSRDRFGIKPFYYTQTPDYFAYNSEIKGLLAKPDISRRINTDAAFAYLNSGLDFFEGDTFFDVIFELNPSHYFIYDISKNNLQIEKYYELSFCDTWEQFNEKKCFNYIENVRNRIFNAVDLRLNADSSLGSCLSGGMDSTAIVCSVARLINEKSYNSIEKKLGVVTSCYNDSPIDESKWAKYAVDHVSADWHRVYPKKEELINDLSDLIYTQDIPFGSTSIYAQYRVMKAAKEAGISVMLDGQGGDELFTGYTPYYHSLYLEAKKNGDNDFLKKEQNHIMNTPFGNINIEKMIQSDSAGKNPVKELLKKCLPDEIQTILRSFLKRKHEPLHEPEFCYLSITGKPYKQYSYATLNQMLYTLMSHTSLPQLLRYADRNSMRFSVVSRTPFADDIDLIEYVFSIPGVYKIHNGWSKYLLRQSMAGIIPNEILNRTDKIGFATPEYDWLESIKPYVFDNINADTGKILKISQLEKDWEKIFIGQNKTGITDIWRYINFILWFNVYKVTI